MELIIIDYYNTEKERKERIRELDKIIKQKEAYISKLCDKENLLLSIENKLKYLQEDAKSIEKHFENINNDMNKFEEIK